MSRSSFFAGKRRATPSAPPLSKVPVHSMEDFSGYYEDGLYPTTVSDSFTDAVVIPDTKAHRRLYVTLSGKFSIVQTIEGRYDPRPSLGDILKMFAPDQVWTEGDLAVAIAVHDRINAAVGLVKMRKSYPHEPGNCILPLDFKKKTTLIKTEAPYTQEKRSLAYKGYKCFRAGFISDFDISADIECGTQAKVGSYDYVIDRDDFGRFYNRCRGKSKVLDY